MYDVICVGGGVAGAATAGMLARNGRRVLVLDKVRIPRDKACGEGILPHGVTVLDRLGVPLPLATLTRGIRFRVDGESAVLRFPEGRGLAVRRYHLDEALRQAAVAAGAEVRPARVLRVEAGGNPRVEAGANPRVHTSDGVFEARVLVGADGGHSVFHRDLGLRVRTPRRSRFGLSTHLTGFEAEPNLVEVVFFDGGEVYIAPVGGGLTLVALLMERRLRLGPSGMLPFLRRLLPDRAQDARLATPVLGAAPLGLSVDRLTGDNWLLVGDSAGRIDPITGEGLSVALVGAEMAAEVIHGALEGSGARVDSGTLAEYEERLRRFCRPIHQLTDLLLLASRRPWLARVLVRRGERMASLMRVATGMEGFSWLRVARAACGPRFQRSRRSSKHVLESTLRS